MRGRCSRISWRGCGGSARAAAPTLVGRRAPPRPPRSAPAATSGPPATAPLGARGPSACPRTWPPTSPTTKAAAPAAPRRTLAWSSSTPCWRAPRCGPTPAGQCPRPSGSCRLPAPLWRAAALPSATGAPTLACSPAGPSPRWSSSARMPTASTWPRSRRTCALGASACAPREAASSSVSVGSASSSSSRRWCPSATDWGACRGGTSS
mmetsp:Transcript_41500/g.117532  ORF Transcript_41500/g.117532 Transcript_41500/m.117532 type:complete len:208 (-) Transcript_41500:722-1345(-)